MRITITEFQNSGKGWPLVACMGVYRLRITISQKRKLNYKKHGDLVVEFMVEQ